MEYDRKKEADPRETVRKVQEILRSLDIPVAETWKHREAGADAPSYAFSLRLHADSFGMGTNGKGSAPEYARASAYGEFMERLQNMFLLPLDRVTQEAMDAGGFSLFPDERLLTQDAVCYGEDSFSRGIVKDYYRGTLLLECGKKERMRVLRDYGANVSLPDEKLITWPFYSVQEDRVVWIWRNYAWEQGSNGMCAGNTPAEALVQGLSEIFERYAIQEVLAGNIIPPDIPPEEYLCYDRISGLIREIENAGPYRIQVKDCSLGKGLPVCAIVLLDMEKHRYRISFGGHPSLPVAIERCLTELVQGYDPRNSRQSDQYLIPVSRDAAKLDPYINIVNMFANGMGVLPYVFWTDPPAHTYTPWKAVDGESNLHLLRRYVTLALSISEDVLIRDVSYLGFPAYQILVPGIGHPRVSRRMRRAINLYRSLSDLQSYRGKTEASELRQLMAAINMWECRSAKSPLPVPSYKLKTAVLMMLGQTEELPAYLDQYLQQIGSADERREMEALSLALSLFRSGLDKIQVRDVISLFYSKKLWELLSENWFCDDPLEVLLSGVETQDKTDRTCSELMLRLKSRFSQTQISQQSLRSLIYP